MTRTANCGNTRRKQQRTRLAGCRGTTKKSRRRAAGVRFSVFFRDEICLAA